MIMYDEPFTGQDPISMGVLVSLIDELNRALNVCSIVVSHDVPETLSIADQVHIISDGKLIDSGTPEALRNSRSAWTRQFIRGDADGPVPFHYPAKPLMEELYQ